MKNLYLAVLARDNNIEVKSAPIESESEDRYYLKRPINKNHSISKKLVASSNGDFFAFGFTEKGALIKLMEKQEEKKQEIQSAIDNIQNRL